MNGSIWSSRSGADVSRAWKPRSTGAGPDVSVSVWPPHEASFSNSVTSCPALRHRTESAVVRVSLIRTKGDPTDRHACLTGCEGCRRKRQMSALRCRAARAAHHEVSVTYAAHLQAPNSSHLCNSQAADNPDMPEPTTAIFLRSIVPLPTRVKLGDLQHLATFRSGAKLVIQVRLGQ